MFGVCGPTSKTKLTRSRESFHHPGTEIGGVSGVIGGQVNRAPAQREMPEEVANHVDAVSGQPSHDREVPQEQPGTELIELFYALPCSFR